MRLRTLLAGTAGGVGLAAVGNRILSRQATQLKPALGRPPKTYRWRGFDISYTEAGSPSDPDLLLLHGINAAGTSAEFAAVFDELAEEYHVLAPDLPGFGASDRPPLLYSPSLYVTFIVDFLQDLTDDARVVGTSLTGVYALMAGTDDESAFSDLVLICPTTSTLPHRTWIRSLVRTPLVGETLFNLVCSKPALRKFSTGHSIYDPSVATEEYINYRWQLTHQPGARFAPASFFSGGLDPQVDLGPSISELDTPVTLVWGRESKTTPLSEGQTLAEETGSRLLVFDEAMLLPHLEHPAEFIDALRDEENEIDGVEERAISH